LPIEMVSLRFYGGVGEIGGNKILLEDGDTRVWLDFGQSFSSGSEYYTDWLKPRGVNGLGDYLEFDLVPKVKGLYSREMLEGSNLCYEEPAFDGVFLSHAHFDHANHIGFIDPAISVYLGAGTKLFVKAMEETGPTRYGEHPYRTFRTGHRIRLNDTEFEPIHVDHSIPGAYGFIIHTSEGSIVYTGDLRVHGPKHQMTEEFFEAAAYVEPIAMITEGTRMEAKSRRRNLSEAHVLQGVKEVCAEASREGKSILYTHGPRDMDRLRTFHSAAESCGRSMVVNTKTAYLLSRLVEDEHLDLPNPAIDDLVSVYYKRKKSGGYDDRDYYLWERPFMGKMVTSEELREKPGDFIVNLDFSSFTELIDIRPEPGSHFIYSMSEPFGEEDIEAQVLQNWLSHFGLKYHQLHASGHISRPELTEAIRAIKPARLFPVHTENPWMFGDIHGNVVQPVVGETYTL